MEQIENLKILRDLLAPLKQHHKTVIRQGGTYSLRVVPDERGKPVHEASEDGAEVDAALEAGYALQHDFEGLHVKLVGEDLGVEWVEVVVVCGVVGGGGGVWSGWGWGWCVEWVAVVAVVVWLLLAVTWMMDSKRYCCAILSLQDVTCPRIIREHRL
jgi:hypothetical protein